jgi:hypothetical protein
MFDPLCRSGPSREELLREFKDALLAFIRANEDVRSVSTKLEHVKSTAYIAKFEAERAEHANARDKALRRLRALETAGPGEGPAFEAGSSHSEVSLCTCQVTVVSVPWLTRRF